jgi:hypothetical protein
MKNKNKNMVFSLFVLSTVMILGSTADAFADHVLDGTTGDGTLEGCLNVVDDSSCNSTDEWKSQNISRDAFYFEGEPIPIRFDITNLDNATASIHEIIFEYDITEKTGGTIKHPFDYILSYNATEAANACVGPDFVNGCVSDSETILLQTAVTTDQTKDSISQPDTSFSLWEDDQKEFYMFAPNGETIEIHHITYLQEGNPGNGGSQTETNQMQVIFETSSSHVVAAFGVHLGNPNEWEHGAGELTGKNFQISCGSVNGNNCTDHVNIDSGVVIPLPEVSINDVSIAEGNSGTTNFDFTLTRTGDLSQTSSVLVSTADGSAMAGDDYESLSNITANFGIDDYTAIVTVTINGDFDVENDETFFVNLTPLVHSKIGDGQGLGTILDDDGGVTITDESITEGDSGTQLLQFTLTRNGDLSETASVTVDTVDGTASAGTDYVAISGGSANFEINSPTTTIDVTVNGDLIAENDETFTVNLSSPVGVIISDGIGLGTITNDDTFGITVGEPTNDTTEAGNGTPATISVVLDSEPTSNECNHRSFLR